MFQNPETRSVTKHSDFTVSADKTKILGFKGNGVPCEQKSKLRTE